MSYFLGIDAGATKTHCVLATDTDELTRVRGGSIKITRVGEADAQKHLEEIFSAVVAQSGVALHSIAGVCVGLSGIAIASVTDWVRRALASYLRCPVILCGDEEVALDAAFHGGRGILAIAGTGSNVVGRTANGQLVHTGGWGPVLSDQGGGSRIGLLALRAIFHAMDASEKTSLLPALHAAWKTRTVEELVELGNRVPGGDLSQLAPLVAECAAQGDAVARRVLEQAGEELADLILLAMRKGASLEALASPNTRAVGCEPWTVAFAGSVVEKIFLVRQSMMWAVHRIDSTVQFHSEPVDPLLGALWRARENISTV